MDDTSSAYDSSAHTYDARYREIQFQKYAYALSLTGPIEGSVLDLGCGTGLFGEFLGREIWGVDSSKGMLACAQGRIRGVCADACSLPFDDGSFDWVVSFTVLQNIPDFACALDEVARVLAHDGRCLLTYLNKPQFAPIGDAICSKFDIISKGHVSEDAVYLCALR